MNITKEINILPISQNNLSDVIDILQSVSEYKPSYSSVLENGIIFLINQIIMV